MSGVVRQGVRDSSLCETVDQRQFLMTCFLSPHPLDIHAQAQEVTSLSRLVVLYYTMLGLV